MTACAPLLLAALALLPAAPLRAQAALDPQTISAILQVADGICGEYFLNGNTSETSFSGAAEGHIKGLAKLMADAGAEGSFAFNEKEYLNVLHEELGTKLTDQRACRLQVWSDMKSALVPQ
ncbi:hypothetical protein [Poseidonocella sp. HB161398]|uniref:hypothetical protein n=1 Tax=Poseidonocella sp. HB161398 TaxID=2320855 RepID=UPI001108867D|nr:hypothetical protein [Poseidonocella sp. HB161398]